MKRESNSMRVGRAKEAKFVCFGDDSSFGNTLVYAFAVVHRHDLANARQQLSILKRRYGISEKAPIHCRVLFNDAARAKSAFSHIGRNELRIMLQEIVNIANLVPIAVRYAVGKLPADIRDPMSVRGIIEMTHVDGGQAHQTPFVLNPKGVLGLLMHGCLAIPFGGAPCPLAGESEIFVSSDSTRVEFIGTRRRRADSMGGFSDIGAPEGYVFEIKPNVVDVPNEPLLEVADVLAYTAAHAESQKPNQEYFASLMQRIRFWDRCIMDLEQMLSIVQPAKSLSPDTGTE